MYAGTECAMMASRALEERVRGTGGLGFRSGSVYMDSVRAVLCVVEEDSFTGLRA